ncbi:MAG: hypothetical protein LBH68_08245, partial [Bifidobacteriaceae bacterium]|nr:hypothetical protein [Bifidobacteriaceae bacterium]
MALGVSRKKAASAAEHRFDGVEVVDAPAVREHQSRDLVGATLALVGLVMVTALAIFAQATAAGVTNDIMAVAHPVASILQIAVSILMNFATLILPAVVIADSLVRRQFWLALQGAVAAVVAFVAAAGAIWLVDAVNYPPLQTGLSVAAAGQYQLTISPLVALMAGVLTAMGPRSRRPIMGVSWNLLWVALAAAVLTGGATLPAAFITVLLGRLVGLATRYVIGVTTDRATGDALVHGIRSAGLKPTRIVRVRDISDPENPTER